MCQANSCLSKDWDPLPSHCPDFTLRANNMEWSSPTAVCSPPPAPGGAEILPWRMEAKTETGTSGPAAGRGPRRLWQERSTAGEGNAIVLGKLQKRTIMTSRAYSGMVKWPLTKLLPMISFDLQVRAEMDSGHQSSKERASLRSPSENES